MGYELDTVERRTVEAVVADLAPDESLLLKQLLRRPSWRDRFQGKAVGYGVDSAVTVLAPYVVLTVVWAKSVIEDEAKTIIGERLRTLTRRVLGVKETDTTEPPARPLEITYDELVKAVTEYGVTLGLRKARAEVLASAVVGRLLVDRK